MAYLTACRLPKVRTVIQNAIKNKEKKTSKKVENG